MPHELAEPDIYVLLARRPRRSALRVLAEADRPLTTTELAERVADRETDDPSFEDRRSVHLALHHAHVPRLAEAGVVSYDGDDGTVAVGPNFEPVYSVLESVSERDLPWSDE